MFQEGKGGRLYDSIWWPKHCFKEPTLGCLIPSTAPPCTLFTLSVEELNTVY